LGDDVGVHNTVTVDMTFVDKDDGGAHREPLVGPVQGDRRAISSGH
jgi:hypothetical protein